MAGMRRGPRRGPTAAGDGPRKHAAAWQVLGADGELELRIVQELARRGELRRPAIFRHGGHPGGDTHNALRRLKRAGHVVTSGRGLHATWRLACPGIYRAYDRLAD